MPCPHAIHPATIRNRTQTTPTSTEMPGLHKRPGLMPSLDHYTVRLTSDSRFLIISSLSFTQLMNTKVDFPFPKGCLMAKNPCPHHPMGTSLRMLMPSSRAFLLTRALGASTVCLWICRRGRQAEGPQSSLLGPRAGIGMHEGSRRGP